jgi:ORF6N domain
MNAIFIARARTRMFVFLLSERVGQFILIIRRQRVLLDEDFAALYGVETRSLVQAVKRNPERFPPDFMFDCVRELAPSLSA